MRKLKNAAGNIGVRIIRLLARRLHLSLLDIGLSDAGYTKSYSMEASGELSFIRDFLKSYVPAEKPVVFDVGSNIGDYAQLIRHYYPQAEMHCFEPNPSTFAALQKNLPAEKYLNNLGLSNERGELQLFFQQQNTTSVQASLDPEILKNIAKAEKVVSVRVQLNTIDEYCAEKGIEQIDFLKIDTEGFELEVLEGASRLLREKKIHCIQFEFNEVNIVKRRFIKDFYDLLTDFEFFRLDQDRMIPMGSWRAEHEVFRFQNLVAVQKSA